MQQQAPEDMQCQAIEVRLPWAEGGIRIDLCGMTPKEDSQISVPVSSHAK